MVKKIIESRILLIIHLIDHVLIYLLKYLLYKLVGDINVRYTTYLHNELFHIHIHKRYKKYMIIKLITIFVYTISVKKSYQKMW